MGINGEKDRRFISKACDLFNIHKCTAIIKKNSFLCGKIIVKTLFGEIIANPDTINSIALACYKAGEMYALDKNYILSDRFYSVGHQIFAILDKAGYYSN